MVNLVWPLIISMSIIQLPSVLSTQPRSSHVLLARELTLDDERMQNTDCGVPFQIELELVIRSYPPALRVVFVLLESQLFTKENLRRVFLCLSVQRLQPEYLSITVQTDKGALQRRINNLLAARGIRRDGTFERESRGTIDGFEEFENKSDYSRAYYSRSAINEQYVFSPDPTKTDLLSEIIRRGQPYAPAGDKSSDLVRASIEGLEREVIRLLSIGADLDGENKFGNTALIAAILSGGAKIVKLLLDRGADVNHKDGEGWTPLMYSLVYRQLFKDDEIAEELLKRGADVNARAKNGDTALTIASEKGAARIVGQLLEKGADPNLRDRHGRTPLMIAEQHGYATILAYLKKASQRK